MILDATNWYDPIINIAQFVWNIIVQIKDVLVDIAKFIANIYEWIITYVTALPSEWASILLTTLIVLIGLLLYRFLK